MAGVLADISLEPTVDFSNPDALEGSPNSGSDSDEAAGVYFGPVQSPEKRLIHAAQPKESSLGSDILEPGPSRARRSGRFTSPFTENVDMSDGNEDSDEGGEDVSQSRSGTPDNVRFPRDEPSSVLASRIIRAHGGPSPPPRARYPAAFASSPLKDSLTFPTHDDDSETPNVDSDLGRRFKAMFDRPTTPSPQTDMDVPALPAFTIHRASLSPSTTPPEPTGQSDASQHDLISFDSFSIPSADAIPENSAGPSTPTPHILPEHSGGLLSPSPRRATSPFRTGLLEANSSPVRRSPRLSSNPQLLFVEGQSTGDHSPASSSLLAVTPEVQDTPPLRRSPRRSATPQGRKPDASTPEPMPALPRDEILPESAEQGLASPTRVKWKGKARAASQDIGEDTTAAVRQARNTGIEDGWEEVNPDELKGEAELEAGKARRDRLQNEGKEKEALMARETRSLSPDSASVLEQLWPSRLDKPTEQQQPTTETVPTDDPPQTAPASPPPVTLVFPVPVLANPLLTSVRRPPIGSPLRTASPSRANHSLNINDLMRSPARRIQINAPIASGSSAQRPGLKPDSTIGAPVRAPIFSRPWGESQTTPAKRAPIPNINSPAKNAREAMRESKSPSRGPSRDRSASAEPRPTMVRGRSASVERSNQRSLEPPSSASKPRSAGKLPFPLISSTNDRPMTIPEESEQPTTSAGDVAAQVPTDSTPLKSHLKQPSTSKIPRIGSKPYARPSSSTRNVEVKAATATRQASTSKTPTTKTLRAVKPAHSSGSSSDDPGSGSGNAANAKAVSTTPSNLKRKRPVDKPSPSQGMPVVLIRQVVPGTLGHKHDGSFGTPVSKKPVLGRTHPSPIKRAPQTMAIRKVTRQPKEPAAPSQVQLKPEENGGIPAVVDSPATDSAQMEEDDPLLMTDHFAATQGERVSSSPTLPAQATPQVLDSDMPKAPSPNEDDDEPEIRVRRTTRARKQVSSSDPFTAPAPRPLAPRRKAPASSRVDDGFAGLTAVALKTLTSSNTTRNQHNFVSLATEIVRKDGLRPDSPMVKIRTITQREEEEKVKGRAERAQRRARKIEGGIDDGDDAGSDKGDSSMLDDGDWEEEIAWSGGHRRGPGDEEDYKTPARPEPPLKRPRFNDDADDAEENLERKRVKWDRGLYSEIYLDEIEVNPNNRSKTVVIKKGCLAPNAKALRLDHLGNISNADTPLNDLVPQNIIVKKFVYDSDILPEAPPPVIKATRSRSKKKN